MTWISVKDRFPGRYTYVLVAAQKDMDVTVISIARHIGFYWEMLSDEANSNAATKFGLTWFMRPNEITHWMELPEPPDSAK